jgi:steroid delta-isomerase-like uncharacterized protein
MAQEATMSKDNKALALRYHADIFQARRLEVADEIIDPDFTLHSPGMASEMSRGPEGVKRLAQAIVAGVPDLQITQEGVIAEDEMVAVRWTMSGTHRGDLFDVPPSDRAFTITGLSVFRVHDARIVELWQAWDRFGLLQQIGAVLSPAPL